MPDIVEHPWESTRGLGFSFGYNQDEDERQSLSGAALVRLLVDVVSKNGNLLINVGPAAGGSIPSLQRQAMWEMGAWLRTNGDAVYGTRPWIRAGESVGAPRSYTRSPGRVHVHALDPATGVLDLPAELAAANDARWADGSVAQVAVRADGTAETAIPASLRAEPVAVLSVSV